MESLCISLRLACLPCLARRVYFSRSFVSQCETNEDKPCKWTRFPEAFLFEKRSKVWMENPDQEMVKLPEKQSISPEEKGRGKSPEVDQVCQVGSVDDDFVKAKAQAISYMADRIQLY